MKVYIMRGSPGSGKSTKAKEIRNEALERKELPYVVSADDFFVRDGQYRFDPTMLGEAHKQCLKFFMLAIHAGHSPVIVDNTNINIEDIAPYYAVGETLGYEVEVIQVEPNDYYVAANRNIHGVPEKKVLDMARRMKSIRLPSRWKVSVVNT